MDQTIRNKLRGVVTQCRKLLEDSVSQELQGKFGIYAANKDAVQVDDDTRMTHLSPEERAARKDILDHFEHIKARGFKPKEALEQLVREIAFTHLNRFCAYKMMEARQVYVGDQRFYDAVGKGADSKAVKFYLADRPDEERLYNTGEQYAAYRHFLDWLGGLLSTEIGVLFNPNDSANRLYPTQNVLDEVLELLNDEALAEIWTQDETIGWVYQYFTPKELRDQARKESAAPRNSYELAFRNQFFTPRYVVEFLTDNTLGRIWYEMRKGNTKLKDQCRYMVRRPTEVFLAEGQSSPLSPPGGLGEQGSGVRGSDDLSQEELLKQPVYIPHRPKKDPRELRILDPACGSGHFLLYCFDLLLTIYEEAYADPDLGPKLKRDYPTLEALQRDVPRLTLAHNLHGIDIDLRASQIAALALWLRCQRAYREMGLKQDRLRITKSNIVCAEPMPGEKEMLDEFLKTLKQDRLETLIRRVMQVPEGSRVRATESMVESLNELVRLVWDKMQVAGEAGSLLKIEQELTEAVRKGQDEWEEKLPLFRFTEFSLTEKPKESYVRYVPGEGVSFWQRAEALVLEALRDYARHTANGGRLQRQLFADDAAQGFAFIDTCQKRFDVVLMNPPFGSPSLLAEDYLHRAYPDARYEAYGQFLLRATAWTEGFVGALTSRGFLFLANYQSIREAVLPHLTVFLDLGAGVLDDAFVEVCASVLSKTLCDEVVCIDDRSGGSRSSLGDRTRSLPPGKVFLKRYIGFLDQSPFCYDTDPTILALFQSGYTLEKALGGLARVGLATGDNERFIRCHWEVPASSINNRWRWHAKGGEYLPFKPDVHLVVDWADNGKPIENAFVGARIHKTDVYFRPAVTYSRRSLVIV